MSKRSAEEIIQAVERYVCGESTRVTERKRLGVSKTTFRSWLRQYETFGPKGEPLHTKIELRLSASVSSTE